MKLFGRNKSENSDVPADLQQYYDNGGTSIGKWILRVVLFLLILGLLIWGGIWLFNTLTGGNGDDGNSSANTNQQQEDRQAADGDKQEGNGQGGSTGAQNKDETTEGGSANGGQNGEEQNGADGTGDAAGANDDTNGTGTTAQSSDGQNGANGQAADDEDGASQAPATSTPTQTTELPNSGPGTVAASLFAGASAIGAVLHSLYIRRIRR